jgi:hypothetical protein
LKVCAEKIMSLRPRYSLLTLLLLTALVAGGVKLWYGPHHEVEFNGDGQDGFHVEDRYTYTRDIRGNRILQGPRVGRLYLVDGKEKQLWYTEVAYYRQGTILKCRYSCQALYCEEVGIPPLPENPFAQSTLSAEEAAELMAVIEQVRPREVGAEMGLVEKFKESVQANDFSIWME